MKTIKNLCQKTKNLFTKTVKEERGDVVQYIIVLAVVAVILAFAFPQIKAKIGTGTTTTMNKMDCAFSEDMESDTCAGGEG